MSNSGGSSGTDVRTEGPEQSVQGIWAVEILGAYDWESRGIFVLENGRAIGGGDRQYSVGRYSVSDGKVKIEFSVHYFGEPRTMWGERRTNFELALEGDIADDGIEAVVSRPDRPQFRLQVRLKRMADLG